MSVRAHERLEYGPAAARDVARLAAVPGRPAARRARHSRAVHLRFTAWVLALVAAISFVGSVLTGPAASGHAGHVHRGGTHRVTETESGRK